MFRKATAADIDQITGIYERIHEREQKGLAQIGWLPGVYPVRNTALAALERDDLFVCEDQGAILASAVINRIQVDVYADGAWLYPAENDEVLVLHTLTVDPEVEHRGVGKSFVAFYEQMAAELGCQTLRMDTNAKNTRARAFYQKLGYREADIVPCVFNGIPGVQLVLLEKEVAPRRAGKAF